MIHKKNSDWLLPALLSTTADAVDVIGFLALGGLFTARITGNLVVLAAHYITGHFGEIAPLLSSADVYGRAGHRNTDVRCKTVTNRPLKAYKKNFMFCEMSIFERLRKE